MAERSTQAEPSANRCHCSLEDEALLGQGSVERLSVLDVSGGCHGQSVDSLSDRSASDSCEPGQRRYLFCAVAPREHWDIHYRYSHASVIDALLGGWSTLRPEVGPAALAVFVGPVVVETHRWSQRDSARLTVFASQTAVDRFESYFPHYRRPRQALDAASFALDRIDHEATHRARRAGGELCRIANRASSQSVPIETIRCVKAVASATRSVAWDYFGGRTRHYVEDALNTVADIDQHLSARIRQWLHFYLHATRNIRPTTEAEFCGVDYFID